MNENLKRALLLGVVVFAAPALAQVTFYEGEGFRGRVFTTDRPVRDFERYGFHGRAASMIIERATWQVCEDARFAGRCSVLRPGSYDSLAGMQLNKPIWSMRPVDDPERYGPLVQAPLAAPNYEYRRRPDERIFAADIVAVRAVVASPEQRCWLESELFSEADHASQIGGILGHQGGDGRGRNVATAGGGAVAARVTRVAASERDLQRCDNIADTTPDYWDVSYVFRGIEHRAQMTAPPGQTIFVNRDGEPRQ